jgi:hypothetical protein
MAQHCGVLMKHEKVMAATDTCAVGFGPAGIDQTSHFKSRANTTFTAVTQCSAIQIKVQITIAGFL